MNQNQNPYQAVLLVSFGGPEGNDDVMPFLQNVLRGRNVPESRMKEVAKHYYAFDGVSPINQQNRQLIQAMEADFKANGLELPIYFGNRNWHPMLKDTLQQMKQDGIKNAIAFFTSAFSCYSGCRQYRENIYQAQQEIGPDAPTVDKIRMCYNHPLFVRASADRVNQALAEFGSDMDDEERLETRVLFTAHSIPQGMADGSDYVKQLTETSRLVAEQVGTKNWELVYQSRSGPPIQPWLEPDVCDRIEQLAADGLERLVIMPVGFLSDHMEVLFDLDVEARETCEEHGIQLARAKTVGTHPEFVAMIRHLIMERSTKGQQPTEKQAIGQFPANHDICPKNCCAMGRHGYVSPV